MRLTVQMRGVDVLSLRTKALIAAAMVGMKNGVSEAGQIVQLEAQALVPVDTGHLRDSIHAELIEVSDTRVSVKVVPAYEEPNPWGFEPAYARRIEYGFVGMDSLGRHYHQAAQPYMRPAWDAKKDEAREAVKTAVYDKLDEAIPR